MTAKPTPKIGGTVQRLRLAAGLTQQHVAELAAIAPETLSRIERNRIAPSLDVVGRLAAALRVKTSDLFAESPKPKVRALRPSDRAWLALVRDLDDAEVDDMVRAVRLMLRVGRRRLGPR
ncbi:MAG: helix-turn-helix transcriptional regulator [Myxococcales bacterium]|nr:helix-turn-helix transcriptional regulator [Myxococcales bacterium]